MKIAVIDIGTNTVLLLIGKYEGRSFRVLRDEARIVRLGEGLKEGGSFSLEAMQRAVDALKGFQQTIDKKDCNKTLIVGTAACRIATNFKDFTQMAREAGIKSEIQIISGEKEAQLIHKGCIQSFEHLPKPLLVLDIGGGSTEFIFDNGQTIQAQSLNFGAVKLMEQFLHTDPPTLEELKALEDHVRQQISALPFINSVPKPQLIATAGTPTTLYAVHKKMAQYDGEKVHGQKMSLDELNNQWSSLIDIPLKIRSLIPCLPPKRADIIIAGSSILKVVMETAGLSEFNISDRGLRYGVMDEAAHS